MHEGRALPVPVCRGRAAAAAPVAVLGEGAAATSAETAAPGEVATVDEDAAAEAVQAHGLADLGTDEQVLDHDLASNV